MDAGTHDRQDSVVGTSEVDEIWKNFHNCLKQLFETSVTYRFVPIRSCDKDWMTPLTKMLILDKWTAFREHDWPRYNHLKLKVRVEVQKGFGLTNLCLALKIYGNSLKRS